MVPPLVLFYDIQFRPASLNIFLDFLKIYLLEKILDPPLQSNPSGFRPDVSSLVVSIFEENDELFVLW